MAKKALCIGINNYPGTHMDLQGCVNDANDWADTLGARGFVVSKLLDDQATKAAMVAALSSLISQARKNDSLVITFSGHDNTWQQVLAEAPGLRRVVVLTNDQTQLPPAQAATTTAPAQRFVWLHQQGGKPLATEAVLAPLF